MLLPAQAIGFAGITTSGPATVSLGAEQILPYRVTFSSAAYSESFSVQVFAPVGPTRTAAMRLTSPPTVVGPGSIGSGGPPYDAPPYVEQVLTPPCNPLPGRAFHGYGLTSTTVRVGLAPFTSITLEYRFRTGETPYHPGDILAPEMIFPSALIQDGDSEPPHSVSFPAPILSGPIGVQFWLKTKPRKHLHAGETIAVRGATTPRLIGRRIRVVATYPRSPKLHVLGTPRTNRAGRFSLAWRPPEHGTYYLGAIFASTGGDRQSDWSNCMDQLDVGPRVGATRSR
jgi:hypothetical protein